MKSFNKNGISRRWLGAGLSLIAAVAAQASTQVTFMVDMAPETPGFTAVYTTGSFPEAGPWHTPNSLLMINTTGTIWSNTFTLSDPVGTVEQVQFTDNTTGWGGVANYEFLLGTTGDTTTTPGTEILPLQTWKAASTWPAPTNTYAATFQVDMSAQVLLGAFTNGVGGNPAPGCSITVSGDFEQNAGSANNWDNGFPLTNDPTLLGSLSNIYSGTFSITNVGYPPDSINYKFRMNGGWESVNNRNPSLALGSTLASPQVLPLVFYNDADAADLMPVPVTVNFTLYCPNGTVDASTPPYAFEKGTDTLWINGDWVPWWGWTIGTGGQAGYQMIEVGTSDYYTNSFLIPKGNAVALTYKYSIDGADNENGFQTNHIRYIRSYGPTYSFPTDQWSFTACPPGTAYPNPGISATNVVEPSFGYLTVGSPSGANVPVTWLGRPGVVLENRSNLSSGIWNPNSGTSGTQSTNWPNAGGSQFFRLLKQ
jgi:hypothetical protein